MAQGVLPCVIDPIFNPGDNALGFGVLGLVKPGVQASAVGWFIALTFAWSWTIWFWLAAHPSITPYSRLWGIIYVAGLGGPLVGATLVSFLSQGWAGLRNLLFQARVPKVSVFWYAGVTLLPPLLWILAARSNHQELVVNATATSVIVLWFKMLIRGGPLTEEMGWRGFLLPKLLSRWNLFYSSLAIFPIWGIWHLPLWLLPGLPHRTWSLALFLLMLAPLTIVMSWLYIRGERTAVFPILLHTSINTTIHFNLVVPTWDTGKPGLIVLFGTFWVVALVLIVSNPRLWFSSARSSKAGNDSKTSSHSQASERHVACSVEEVSGASQN